MVSQSRCTATSDSNVSIGFVAAVVIVAIGFVAIVDVVVSVMVLIGGDFDA